MLEFDTDAPRRAQKFCLHGAPGSGKSSLASGAPKSVVLDIENSTLAIREWDGRRIIFQRESDPSRHRYHPNDWKELLTKVQEVKRAIEAGQVDVGTLVLDGFGRAEKLCEQHVCANWTKKNGETGKIANIKQPGYGDGEAALLTEMLRLLHELEQVWALNVGIVLICHSAQVSMPNPSGERWKAWGPALTSTNTGDVSGYVRGWVDHVWYLDLEVQTVKVDLDKPRARTIGTSTGQRILTVQQTATVLAKYRGFPVGVDPEIPVPPVGGWQAIERHVKAGPLPTLDVAALRALGNERLAASKIDEAKKQKLSAWLAQDGLDAQTIWTTISTWK